MLHASAAVACSAAQPCLQVEEEFEEAPPGGPRTEEKEEDEKGLQEIMEAKVRSSSPSVPRLAD